MYDSAESNEWVKKEEWDKTPRIKKRVTKDNTWKFQLKNGSEGPVKGL